MVEAGVAVGPTGVLVGVIGGITPPVPTGVEAPGVGAAIGVVTGTVVLLMTGMVTVPEVVTG